jgi:enamine deaminase RidA (YjgF/YER057c/UK114 family)
VVTATPWEVEVGYARAVRIGDRIAVSGTVAAGEDGHATAADAYGQAREIFRILDGVLRRLGGRLDSVLRLRVPDVVPRVGPGFTRALKEAFPEGAPALTGLRVTGLVEAEFLLEVEADAVAGEWESEAPPLPEWDEDVD